jgi:ABC-type bacteriocin/lantibiotic exporter with double-glycine peptidase domain
MLPERGPTEAHAHEGAHHGSPVQRIFELLRSERRDLWVVFIYATGVGLLSLAVPVATASLVNSISFGTVLQPVVVLTFLVLVVLGFKGLMQGLQFWVIEMLQRRVFVQVAIDLARRLPRVRAAAFDRANAPELVNRFFDVLTVQKTVATLLLDGLTIFLQAIIGTLLLAFYHPVLLAFDVVLVVAMVVILFPLGRGAIETSIGESKAKYAVAAWLEELARQARTFRIAGASSFAVRRADALSQKYLKARAAHFRIVLRQHIGSLTFKDLLSAALLGLGGWLVINRGLSIGQLVAAELVVSIVVAGMAKFAKQLESWYDLVAALDKLGHLTDLPLERQGGAVLPRGDVRGARVALRDLSFSYDDRVSLLRNVELSLEPGARVAIIGRSGSGKSAIADLVLGQRAPTGGAIVLEGADLRELSLESVREAVAVVRDADVFEGTVIDNIAVGRPGITAEHVREALATLRLDGPVAMLPDGVNTWLVPSGAPLSASQALTLMFARAIAAQPRFIVIDGALDAIDPEVVAEVFNALCSSSAPWTLLVLTHRAEIAALCDRVYRIDAGALTTHTTPYRP